MAKSSRAKSIEFWLAIRALVESGSSLTKAAKDNGISLSHLRERAAIEAWQLPTRGRGRPRTLDYTNSEHLAMVEKLLAEHSLEARQTLSRLVLRTFKQIETDEMKAKERAQALVAIRSVAERLYGWDKEVVSLRGNGAINLALINTTPEQLRALSNSERPARELE
jgi:hypothetical protein